jgi:hypothetical protein
MNTRGEGVWGKPDGWNWGWTAGDRGQRDRRSGVKARVKTAGYAVRGAECAAHPAPNVVQCWLAGGVESSKQTSRKVKAGRPDVTEAHRLFQVHPRRRHLSILAPT